MPIVIKNFKWKQTDLKIIIEVPMPEIYVFKADVLITPKYLKASHKAYFFEVVLLNSIDVKASKCTKTSGELIFELQKEQNIHWEILEVDLPKSEKLELKKKLLLEETKRAQTESENKINKKAELKRAAVGAQIELDTKTRNRIETIKKEEEHLALGDINKWKKEVTTNSNKNQIVEISDDFDVHVDKEIKSSAKIVELNHKAQIKDAIKLNSVTPILTYNKKENYKPNETVNKPRSTRSLQILFSEREFTTPCRESRMEEENDFLKKQAEVRRSVGFDSKDLRPEEKSPQYMLDKGQEFMSVKNYLGAISAFSFGIKLSPKFLDLYIARSEANLAMGNFNNCVEDTSAALNFLKPALPINLDQRALCIGRRGLALCKLGFLKHGIPELEASLKLKNDACFKKALEDAKEELASIKEKEKIQESQKNNCESNKNSGT